MTFKKRGPDNWTLKFYCIKTLPHGRRLRLIQRQNDGDSCSDIGKENSNQQANKPLEVAVGSILDISKTAVHVVQSAVHAIQSVADLLKERFQNMSPFSA